jgi:hypothetical protein
MSEQTFFIGDKCHGNNIERGNCPCCGGGELTYSSAEFVDDNINYPWECRDCGSIGSEWYSLEFSGHNVSEDNKNVVEEDVDTDDSKVEVIIDVHLMSIINAIGMDKPENYDEMLEFVCEDIKETADKEFSHGDVVIAFRRFLEKK